MTLPKKFLEKYIEQYIWSVIPVGEDKRPVIPWKKYQKKLLSVREFEAVVNHMRNIKPNSKRRFTTGIGLVTGKISHVTVVDLDDDYDKELASLIENIETPTVRTGGGGRHFYFKYCPDISQTQDPNLHIDIRNDGGYAVLPPSESTKGKYSWIKSPDDVEFAELPDEFVKRYGATAKEKVPLNFKPVPKGARNNTAARIAGKIIQVTKPDLEAAWQQFVSWNETFCKPPLPIEELKITFESIVKIDGKNNPEPRATKLSELIDSVDFTSEESVRSGYSYFDKDVGGIYLGVLTTIAAQTGVGKSIFILNMFDRILKNNDIRAAYFDLENGRRQTLERLYRIHYRKSKKEWNKVRGDKKALKNLMQEAFGDRFSLYFRENGMRDPETLLKTMEKEAEKGTKLFLIDPLQKIEGGERIDEQGKIVGNLSDFAQKTNVAVILCHHVRKSTTAGGDYVSSMDEVSEIKYLDPTLEDVKGGSIITDTSEIVLALTRAFAAVRETPKEQDLVRSRFKVKVLKCRTNARALGVYKFYLDLDNLNIYESESMLSCMDDSIFNSEGGWERA